MMLQEVTPLALQGVTPLALQGVTALHEMQGLVKRFSHVMRGRKRFFVRLKVALEKIGKVRERYTGTRKSATRGGKASGRGLQ